MQRLAEHQPRDDRRINRPELKHHADARNAQLALPHQNTRNRITDSRALAVNVLGHLRNKSE